MPAGGRLAAGPGCGAGDAPAHCVSPRAGFVALPRAAQRARRLGDGLAVRALPFAVGPGRTLGEGAAHADCPHLSGTARRRRAEDIPRPQPPDRSATAPVATARTGPRLREPARLSRGRRPARHLLDGHGAARHSHHSPVPDRAQPAGLDRARLRQADAGARGCFTVNERAQLSGKPFQARLRLHDGCRAGATGALLR